MRKILLAFSCLLVLNACQKEINGDLPVTKENTTISYKDCPCRLSNLIETDGYGKKIYELIYEDDKIGINIAMVSRPVSILLTGDDKAYPIIAEPPTDAFSLWEPEPISYTYDPKGVLLAVTATDKALSFEYSVSGKIWKIRRFNAGSTNGYTPPYRYYRPTYDERGNIVLLKEFDMAGHEVGKIGITYSDVPNTLSSLTPFNFEKDLTSHSVFPLITYFVHQSRFLVSSVAVNDEPVIRWSYNLETSPREITISRGEGNYRQYYYECQLP